MLVRVTVVMMVMAVTVLVPVIVMVDALVRAAAARVFAEQQRDQLHAVGLAHVGKLRVGLEGHRLKNLTGNMLSSRSYAATRYMSLWIEAKNKV